MSFMTHLGHVPGAQSHLSKTNRNRRVHTPRQAACFYPRRAGDASIVRLPSHPKQTAVREGKVFIMLKRIFALGLATVAFGSLAFVDSAISTAFAGEGQDVLMESRPVGPELCSQQLSFQSFQNACTNPDGNGWQIRPAAINITCTKRELVWIPSPTKLEMRLPTLVDIDVSLGGKKKCVDDNSSYQSEIVEQATCFQFEQVERNYSRTIVATCDDLLKHSSAIELCDVALKGSPAGWTQLPGEQKTNLVMNSCASAMTQDTGKKEELFAPVTQPQSPEQPGFVGQP
jgi:hypothetical protein